VSHDCNISYLLTGQQAASTCTTGLYQLTMHIQMVKTSMEDTLALFDIQRTVHRDIFL